MIRRELVVVALVSGLVLLVIGVVFDQLTFKSTSLLFIGFTIASLGGNHPG
jgi:hypothetical protein